MANNRIFYACQAVALSPQFPNTSDRDFIPVHGVQSVGVNTTFNLEQAFELGQIYIYENIEGLPDIEVTIERVLDGYPLAYRLATRKASNGLSPGDTLVERSKERCCAALGIYEDSKNSVSGVSTAPMEVFMSGMYVNSVSYTLPTDGNATESITLVGNHKVWSTTGGYTAKILTQQTDEFKYSNSGDIPKNNQAGTYAGGIQRRENVLMASSILPKSIYGVNQVNTAGNNWDSVVLSPKAHVQSVSISTDLGRENILELGRKAPYYRAPNFPIEVTCEFDVIAISGDLVNAYEEGNPDYVGTASEGNNTSLETIKIILQDATTFDLGANNRLSSITYGGGDAGGGNATIKYSYSTFNDFTVKGPHNNAGETTT
jgi:hypothetical protein